MTLDAMIEEVENKGYHELARVARSEAIVLPTPEWVDARCLLATELLANAAENILFCLEQTGDNFREELRQAWQHYAETVAER